MIETSTLIVGAGPAGLAVAGRLRQAGLEYEIVERSDRVADSWHHHYHRLHLHTVKELSQLPGVPFPDHYPRYVPRADLAAYYQDYAGRMSIHPRFGEEVTTIRRRGSAWRTETETGTVFTSRHVVVATGSNRVPNRPPLSGEDGFTGEILHSRHYRNPTRFTGRSVLVIGMGNTGAEIAFDLAEVGIDLAISVRGPVNIVPRDFLGRPTQLTALTLSRLPERLGDRIGSFLRWITVGDLSRYGLETPELPPLAQLRTRGQTPVIDVGTVEAIKRGRITVYPAVARLDGDRVVFVDGRRRRIDVIVLATGYRARLEDLLDDTEGLLDDNGYPLDCVGRGRFRGLFFVGFDNYRPGGILGTIVTESARVVEEIRPAPVTV